jgi:hypothetical protein
MRFRLLHLLILLASLAVTACAAALPPVVQISDIRVVAGTYSGSTKEYGFTPRPTRLTINPDNTFEMTTGGPDGARISGVMAVAPDGTLGYTTNRVRGRGVVHQGDGRQVIIFGSEDGSTTTRVERPLP